MEETSRRTIIRMRGIYKSFYIGAPNELEILHGIDLDVQEGEFLSIVGPSGSGKSTLMNVIGVLDRPTEGTYDLDGTVVSQARDDELSSIRNPEDRLCVSELQPHLPDQRPEECGAAYDVCRGPRRQALRPGKGAAGDGGHGNRLTHQPSELSGGQKQRVAIARPWPTTRPSSWLTNPPAPWTAKPGGCDGPVPPAQPGAGKTIVLITHNQERALETDRFVTMRDGRLYVGDTGEEVRYGDR